ncbi:hypothetical protein BDF14DRAFT_1803175 [Spinellus fusiger]|nr:hypothetical protein BDF14DRAFT_1803175 [Spinellus fusiger]
MTRHSMASEASSSPKDQNQSPAMQKQRRPIERPIRTVSHDNERPPSHCAFVLGHCKSLCTAFVHFALKHNNLVLLLNLAHHVWNTRTLLATLPLNTPPTHVLGASLTTAHMRTLGAMHLAFAALAAMSLQEQHRSTQRSTLLVLTMAAMGQAWSYMSLARSYRVALYQQHRQGLFNSLVCVMSAVAFYQTGRATH